MNPRNSLISGRLAIALCLSAGQCAAQIADTTHSLPELTVRDHYKSDSLDMRLTYKKPFDVAGHKVRVHFGRTIRPSGRVGLDIIYDGLLTEAAYILSGKKRQARTFRKNFLQDEKVRASWRYYSVDMVMMTTSLDSADAYRFRLAHPMPKDVYEGASRLEQLQWIRSVWQSDR